MKPILVVVHVFYEEMLPELNKALDSFRTFPHEVWVTYVETNDKIVEKLRHFEHVVPVPNRGYDVGPFLCILNQVDLQKYSYIAKIHTKRDLKNGTYIRYVNLSGDRWRKYLLSFTIYHNLKICLREFERKPRLGMVAHHALIQQKEPSDSLAWNAGVDLLRQAGIVEKKSKFVCGTMFMCRAELMQPVKDLLATEKFEIPSRVVHSSISHAVERFLGMVVTGLGYEIADVYTSKRKKIWFVFYSCLPYILSSFFRFCFQFKKKESGGFIIKILKVPVYYKKGVR